MIENSFDIRERQRCQQTISKGEVIFRFVTEAYKVSTDRSICIVNYCVHKFACFALGVNHGKSFDKILKRGSA